MLSKPRMRPSRTTQRRAARRSREGPVRCPAPLLYLASASAPPFPNSPKRKVPSPDNSRRHLRSSSRWSSLAKSWALYRVSIWLPAPLDEYNHSPFLRCLWRRCNTRQRPYSNLKCFWPKRRPRRQPEAAKEEEGAKLTRPLLWPPSSSSRPSNRRCLQCSNKCSGCRRCTARRIR